MRVPSRTIYDTSRYQLGTLTEGLKDSNKIVSTQKRINIMSDDPIGFSQVLDLKSSLKNIEQVDLNIRVGKNWLTGAETSLDSVNDLVLDTKVLATQLMNAGVSAKERQDAEERVDGMLRQMISLSNTEVNGSYLFGGTDTEVRPFEFDETDEPQVKYLGNKNPVGIKLDIGTNILVGQDGSEVFWDDEITINESNHSIDFREDNGKGPDAVRYIHAEVPDGSYTRDELKTAIRNVMNDASKTKGYGATYQVDYDPDQERFHISDSNEMDGYFKFEMLWETGNQARIDHIATKGNIERDDVEVIMKNRAALTSATPEPPGTDPMKLTWDGEGNWVLENNPGYMLPDTIAGSPDTIELDLTDNGVADVVVRLKNPAITKGDQVSFDIFTASYDTSLGVDIGFDKKNLSHIPPTSNQEIVSLKDIKVDQHNNKINFEETTELGSVQLTATIPEGEYRTGEELAAAIETAMEEASDPGLKPFFPPGNKIDYSVTYDSATSKFRIKEDGSVLDRLSLLWENGENRPEALGGVGGSAAGLLGFDLVDDVVAYPESDTEVTLVRIDNTNNMIDFKQKNASGMSDELTAVIPPGPVPGGGYASLADFADAVELAMNRASMNGSTYSVSVTDGKFTIAQDAPAPGDELQLLWEGGTHAYRNAAGILGFNRVDQTNPASVREGDQGIDLFQFDDSNNRIDFVEYNADGEHTAQLTAVIPKGEYKTIESLTSAISTTMKEESLKKGYQIDYRVEYDAVRHRFLIKGGDENFDGLRLLWQTGTHKDASAASALGFSQLEDDQVEFPISDKEVVHITIDDKNNKIDFKEQLDDASAELSGEISAFIREGVYNTREELALAVESALEKGSKARGNEIDYKVTYDADTHHYTIKENGKQLKEFQLLWDTGANGPLESGGTGQSAAQMLGFSDNDAVAKRVSSEKKVEWGLFKTMIDLKEYLANNDVDGINRSMTRLDTHYNYITSTMADIGVKYNRLEIKEKINTDLNLSLTDRRSKLEDADIVTAVMDLQAAELAYQASLSSTAKVLKMSLVDFL